MMPELLVRGPTVLLRYPRADDALRLLELGSEPQIGRWWPAGPYASIAEPRAYLATVERRRDAGEALHFAVEHGDRGLVGMTGLSEPASGAATVGTWIGRAEWGSGVNQESKQLLAALAFERLGLDRLTARVDANNARALAALERAGFERDASTSAGERGDHVVAFVLERERWEPTVAATIGGAAPAAWRFG
jgi:[ribosomal protein S5]-alanine N-acetyltransferase